MQCMNFNLFSLPFTKALSLKRSDSAESLLMLLSLDFTVSLCWNPSSSYSGQAEGLSKHGGLEMGEQEAGRNEGPWFLSG